jgi:hypothetical protein
MSYRSLSLQFSAPLNRLAFTRVGEGADLNNRRGQGEWVIVNNPNHWEFKDVARFQGQLYMDFVITACWYALNLMILSQLGSSYCFPPHAHKM